LLAGNVNVEFDGNFSEELYEFRYMAENPFDGPGFLYAFTIDQLPVNPTLSLLPVEFIFAEFVPVSDSYREGAAAVADWESKIGKILRKTIIANIFAMIFFIGPY